MLLPPRWIPLSIDHDATGVAIFQLRLAPSLGYDETPAACAPSHSTRAARRHSTILDLRLAPDDRQPVAARGDRHRGAGARAGADRVRAVGRRPRADVPADQVGAGPRPRRGAAAVLERSVRAGRAPDRREPRRGILSAQLGVVPAPGGRDRLPADLVAALRGDRRGDICLCAHPGDRAGRLGDGRGGLRALRVPGGARRA